MLWKTNELVANTTEAAVEKYIPVVNIDGNKVKVQVGSTLHPMIPEHYIAWIYVVTNEGIERKNLDRNGETVAEFALNDNENFIFLVVKTTYLHLKQIVYSIYID